MSVVGKSLRLLDDYMLLSYVNSPFVYLVDAEGLYNIALYFYLDLLILTPFFA